MLSEKAAMQGDFEERTENLRSHLAESHATAIAGVKQECETKLGRAREEFARRIRALEELRKEVTDRLDGSMTFAVPATATAGCGEGANDSGPKKTRADIWFELRDSGELPWEYKQSRSM